MNAVILVTYNPNIDELQKCINSLLNKETIIIIVKNSNEILPATITSVTNIYIIQLNDNMGIAFAQNCGLKKAKELNVDWILFSDQDTIFPQDYINQIIGKARELKLDKIGGLCPIFFDEIKGINSKVMISKMRKRKVKNEKYIQVAHTISSGTLVPLNVVDQIGLFNESLFIDFVDYEWNWRFEKNDLRLYCIPSIKIRHRLGDALVNKWGISIVSRSLFRFYYIIRNGYYLLTTDYLHGVDRFLFKLMLQKKMIEVLCLNNFSKESKCMLCRAKRNGKHKNLEKY